jgi:signal transduction histidine kinase
MRAHPSSAVSVELPAGPLQITIDDARLRQVLLNLLENAARYSPEGAPIDVVVSSPRPAALRVTVNC